MTTASAVSRHLGKSFTRSTTRATRVRGFAKTSAGFECRQAPDGSGKVWVEHVHGDGAMRMQADQREAQAKAAREGYEQALTQRWSVQPHPDKPYILVVG